MGLDMSRFTSTLENILPAGGCVVRGINMHDDGSISVKYLTDDGLLVETEKRKVGRLEPHPFYRDWNGTGAIIERMQELGYCYSSFSGKLFEDNSWGYSWLFYGEIDDFIKAEATIDNSIHLAVQIAALKALEVIV